MVELCRYLFNIDTVGDLEGEAHILPRMIGTIRLSLETPEVDIRAHTGSLLRLSVAELARVAIFVSPTFADVWRPTSRTAGRRRRRPWQFSRR